MNKLDTTKTKILFIINPITGRQKLKLLPLLIKKHLNTAHHYQLATSEYKGHARQLARDAIRNGFNMVVAVGGDGTVNEVGSQLIHTGVSLGIIPNGSGNGLARELGIPLQIPKAIQLLNQFRYRTIDAGMVNDQPFFCTSGVGFDAHIGKLFAESQTRGFYTYVQKVMGAFWKYAPLEYSIANGTTGQKTEKAFAITIANARQYGNNAYIAPEANLEDGLLDFCMIKPFPRFQMMDLGLRLFNGKINGSVYYSSSKVKHLTVVNPQANCFHLDGEHCELKDGKLNFSVAPKVLKVAAPF